MLSQIADILHRSRDTIWQDALGAVALMVLLLAGLHLPGMI
ncbi:hypothetical protein [Marimonas arenosa]|uniref:Uncharacterized protein n=1 Tax=Marimonas arenosa TaxID=1795305 RepID=A0AAE3WB69_9RHOB|nr:hypothetical protein [Marimonas arenosa]MDQ2088480.1 hypothetical protein [Marimonas arenosa]